MVGRAVDDRPLDQGPGGQAGPQPGLLGQEAAPADVVPAIPLDPFPDLVISNTRQIGGPAGHNFAFGPWVNMNAFFLRH